VADTETHGVQLTFTLGPEVMFGDIFEKYASFIEVVFLQNVK
jgi:hypothetical protein